MGFTHSAFAIEVRDRTRSLARNRRLKELSHQWIEQSLRLKYTHNFSWLGRPVIQFPQDLVALQELISKVKPDLVIETGIAHGGSLIFTASLLALIDYMEAAENNTTIDPRHCRRRVLGVDIDIRKHNRKAIEMHPLSGRIDMLQGSSVDPQMISAVRAYARDFQSVFVCLDSDHSHAHVLAELQAYSPLTTKGSYCVVFDTVVQQLPERLVSGRPWGKGNNPATAVTEFLRKNDRFVVDQEIENKLLITCAQRGFLKCVKD